MGGGIRLGRRCSRIVRLLDGAMRQFGRSEGGIEEGLEVGKGEKGLYTMCLAYET